MNSSWCLVLGEGLSQRLNASAQGQAAPDAPLSDCIGIALRDLMPRRE
jgi:hypothetical protein